MTILLSHGLLLFMFSFFVAITVLCIWCRCIWTNYTIPTGVIGLIGYIVLFYYSFNEQNITYPSFINPFSIVILGGSIPFGVFVSAFAFRQTNIFSKGYTTKQMESITKNILNNDNRNKNTPYTLKFNITIKERFYNMLAFLKLPKPKSLIQINDL